MEKTTKMCVAVHKQLLRLGEDETINSFLTKVRDASEIYLAGELALSDDRYVWACEVWSNAVVVQVTDYKNREVDGYYGFSYERISESDFEFGDPIKVELKTYYEIKPETVQKSFESSKNLHWVEENLWDGAF